MAGIPRRVSFAFLAFLLTMAPACSATAGHKWGQASPAPDGSQRRISLRPLYDPSRAKKFYLSGYAGANYGPGGPGGMVYPSTYRQATGLGPYSAFGFLFHGHGH